VIILDDEKPVKINTIFKKLSKILGIDLKYFTFGSIYSILGNLFLSITGFLITILFTNFCSQEIYGQFNYIISIISMLEIFSFSGFRIAILESSSKGYKNSFLKGTLFRVIGSLIIIPGSIFLSISYYNNGNPSFGLIFLVLCVFYPFYYASMNYTFYNNALKDFKLNFIFSTGQAIILGVLFSLIILNFANNIIVILVGYVTIYFIINSVFWIISFLKKREFKSSKDPDFIKYGLFFSLIDGIVLLSSNIDKFLIGTFLSFNLLAIYSIALKIPEIMKNNIKFINFLIIPKISEKETKKNILSKKQILLLIFLGIGLIVVTSILSPFLILLFFTTSYYESILYSQIYSLCFPLIFLDYSIYSIFIVEKRKKFLLLRNILFPLIFLGFFPILFIYLGLLGVIIAHILSYNLTAIISFILYKIRK